MKNDTTGAQAYIAFLTNDEFYMNLYGDKYISATGLEKAKIYSKDITVDGETQTFRYYRYTDIKGYITSTKDTDNQYYAYDPEIQRKQINVHDTDLWLNISAYPTLNYSVNDIGAGWRFDFPEIMLTGYDYDLYNGSNRQKDYEVYYAGAFKNIEGRVYAFNGSLSEQIRRSGDEDVYTYRSLLTPDEADYLEFTELFESRTLDNGAVYNFTVLDRKNLITYYFFSDNGPGSMSMNLRLKISAVADNYGNAIRYQYGTNGKISGIIDTYGRNISVSAEGISYFEPASQSQRTISYSVEQMPGTYLDNESPTNGTPVQKFTVTNELGENTVYDMRNVSSLSVYCLAKNKGTLNEKFSYNAYSCGVAKATNVERITYPTGAQKHIRYRLIYPYSQKIKRSVYAVDKMYDSVGTVMSNMSIFEFDDNPENAKITQTDGETTQKHTRNYSEGRCTEDTVYDNGVRYSQTWSYSDGQLTQDNITQSYSGGSVTASCSYTYLMNDVVASETKGDLKVSYTYHVVDGKFTGIPKTTTYAEKRYVNGRYSYTNVYMTETTLTEDNRSIEYEYTKDMSGAILAQKKYEYDSFGNVTAEHIWLKDANSDGVYDFDDDIVSRYYAEVLNPDSTVNVTLSGSNTINADGETEAAAQTGYKLDLYGNAVSKTDPLGNVSYITYDALSRPLLYTLPNGSTMQIEYNQAQNYTCVTDRTGAKTKYVYNARNKLIGVYKQIGDEWIMLESSEYDSKERPRQKITYTSLTDGTKEIYSYDCISRPVVRSVYTLDGEEKYTERTAYSVKSGKVHETKTIDELPVSQETTVYDEFGKNCGQIRKYGDTEYSSTIEYDYLDRKIAGVDPRGARTEYAYDTRGNLVSKTDSSGAMTTYSYDMAGRKLKETDARQNITHFTYDELGRIIRVTSPADGNQTAETLTYYDLNSNVIKEKIKTENEQYIVTEYAYDNTGNVTTVTGKCNEGDSVVRNVYDSAGRVIKQFNGDAYIQYAYNNAGYVSTFTDALGRSEQYTAYDYLGRVLSRTDRMGKITACTYLPEGIISENVDGDIVSYTYDELGRISTKTAPGGSISYTYDPFGRIASETADGRVKTYTYDACSNVTGFSLSKDGVTEKSIAYEYDSMNRLTKLTEGDKIFTYTYDVVGNLTQKTAGNITTNYTYNNANAVTLLENTLGDTVLSRYTCNYTPDGKRHSESGNNNYSHIYTYDTLGRLVCEAQSSPAAWYALTVNSYTYDTRGNRTSITVTGPERYSETYTYDRNNRIASYARTENGDTRTTSYTYDLNGNLISEQTDGAVKNYTYDARNRLVQMDAEGVAASYTYNADGLRASKTVNGVRNGYVWNGMNMICETSGSDITDSHTYDNMGIAMTKRGDAGSIYLKNAHNDIMQVTDFAGEIQQRHRYDAFGRAMAAETEPDDTAAAQSIMNVTPEPISTPAPEYDELQAYTADNDTTYVAMQEGKVYLSDMPWKSATNGWGPAERDMNNKESLPNDGDTITINGVQYEKGIGCHTVSNIEIELGKGYDLFETVVGVDDYTPPGSGNVKFSVYGDGELLAQTDYMTGSDDGQALSVDVGNVQVLKLSATNNGSNNHNHADWADAKLTPKTQTVDMGYFGYCGEYYDPELDMIYLRNRYYSPGIGRFITEDPARDGVNWYAYCNNNPVMFVDPSGERGIKVASTLLLDAFFGGGANKDYVRNQDFYTTFYLSPILNKEINKRFEEFKLSGESSSRVSESIAFYGNDLNPDDFDLHLGVGKANYTMEFKKEAVNKRFLWKTWNETQYSVTVTISDTYDFDEYREGRTISNWLNNWGYDMQKKGNLTPFFWSYQFKKGL